jgi:hypothetical protein
MKKNCTTCKRKAKFDVPYRLCTIHWAEWWVRGLGMPGDRYVDELRYTIKRLQRKTR